MNTCYGAFGSITGINPMRETFWHRVGETLSWPRDARHSVYIRIVAVGQVFLFVLGTKTAFENGGWWWGLPFASVVAYVLTDVIIGAFLFINLMNPFNRD
jgi:hypothetical protein